MNSEGTAAEMSRDLEAAKARLRLLADTGVVLANMLDADEALRRLAWLLVPELADACVVDVVEGGRVRRLAAAYHDPAPSPPPPPEEPRLENSAAPLARVLRGVGPLVVTDFPDSDSGDVLHRAQLELYRVVGAKEVLIVPLQVRRDILGALSLIRSSGLHDPFDHQIIALASDLAHRAGLTLENSRLYRFQQATAEALQRSLLPELSGLEHLQLAARYVPARQGAEVGGDWYDAFTLPDGSTVLAIGDVVGHDLTAAVRMGQLRNMLRALAYDSGDSPAGVMRRLDNVMQGLSSTELVTAAIVRVYMPTSGPWLVHWTNAGHPPPLLISPTGGTRLLEDGLAPVLGVDPALGREDALAVLPSGSTLLLYTDGLVERPGESLTRGLTRLRQHAAKLASRPLQAFCDELLTALVSEHHDDVAILVLRVPEWT